MFNNKWYYPRSVLIEGGDEDTTPALTEFKEAVENSANYVVFKPDMGSGGRGIEITQTRDLLLFNFSRAGVL